MTTRTYIVLSNSDYSVSVRYRVVMGTLAPLRQRQQTRKRTLTGKSDSQSGNQYQGWSMTLRVHAASDLAGYGLLADLETLYSYNNPSGVPSNQIHYTDHLGVDTLVEFVGNLSKDNLTPYLDGPDAAYLIPITIEES
jgi:hypothetical protein